MAVLGLGFLVKMAVMSGAHLPPMTPIAAEQAMLKDKAAGPLFLTIKRAYPDDFENLKNDIAKRGQSFEGDSKISDGVLAYLTSAQAQHRKDMEQAPHKALTDYREAGIDLVEALQSADPQLCADY